MKKNKIVSLLILLSLALLATSCTNADDPITTDNSNASKGFLSTPFSVTEAFSNQGQLKYVTGYVVGYITYKKSFAYTFGADTCTQKVNILLAETLNETNPDQCLSVELPEGAIRDSLNLSANKKRFGHKIKLFGLIEYFWGKTGIRNTSYFIDGKDSIGVKPANVIFSEKFQTSLGQFTSVSVSGSEKWYWTTYKYAMVTGYVSSVNKADTCWMISPAVDLKSVVTPKMSFDHVTRYFNNPATDATVWVSDNYDSGLPSTATWTQVPTNFTNASSWTFGSSGEISLQPYAGKKIRVGFKYMSSTTKAGTWELKNFQIYER